MSANNKILIVARNAKYEVREFDVDTGNGFYIATCSSLEEAIRKANKYQEENPVEYGLDIKI